jgi:hypothetical protein
MVVDEFEVIDVKEGDGLLILIINFFVIVIKTITIANLSKLIGSGFIENLILQRYGVPHEHREIASNESEDNDRVSDKQSHPKPTVD